MAAQVAPSSLRPRGNESESEELSDSEIQRLLKEAEARLRAAAEAKTETPHPPTDYVGSGTAKRTPLPTLKVGFKDEPYIHNHNGIAQADPARIVGQEQRKLADILRAVESKDKSKKTNDQLTSGPDWFDLPKTVLTPQLKRDFQMLEMRSVLDPHRHYKKDSRKGKTPTFSQVGTVIQGPTEWFSSRINKKDRAKNFVEEAMATERDTGRFKRKYGEIQEAKTSGKKAHYKRLMAKRKKKP